MYGFRFDSQSSALNQKVYSSKMRQPTKAVICHGSFKLLLMPRNSDPVNSAATE